MNQLLKKASSSSLGSSCACLYDVYMFVVSRFILVYPCNSLSLCVYNTSFVGVDIYNRMSPCSTACSILLNAAAATAGTAIGTDTASHLFVF